jgi:hypothetical protein
VDLEVDTDTSRPEETATAIIERFGLSPEPVIERYPAAPSS